MMDDALISDVPSEAILLAIGSDPEAAQAILEELERIAKVAEDEKRAAMDKVASDVEAQLRARMLQRAQKEAEWTTSRELFMGALGNPIRSRIFPSDEEKREAGGRRKLRLNIIKPKVKTAVSQMIAAQFGGGEKNWTLLPSKRVEIDTNVDPQIAVKLMEDIIEDQLEATDYVRETKLSMYDMAVLGTGVMKGPINTGHLKKIWEQQQSVDANGNPTVIRVPTLVPEYIPCIKRVDLWMFFPDMTVSRIKDAEDAIEIHPMSKRDMQKLQKHPGYFGDVITEILAEGKKDFVTQVQLPPYSFLNSELFKDKFLVAERHGRLERDCLCKMGIDIPESDTKESFWAEVWVCNGKVIRLELSNLEATDCVPYAVDTWEEDPSSIFGFGLPLLNEDQQRVAEGMWDVIVENAKISSGPQVVIDKSLIEPNKDGRYDIEPWNVLLTKGFGVDVNQAIQFKEIPNVQQPLTNVLEMAKSFADEEAAIPLLAGGMEAPQMTSGATGLALIAKAGTSVLHEKAQQWDDNITGCVIQWMYDWNMQYGDDESAKGDFEVDVRSTTSYLRQHMEIVNLEKLIAQTSQNPELQKIIKLDQAARALVSNMQLPSNNLVRNAQEQQQWDQEQQQKQQNQPPDPQVLKAQADMARIEVEKEKIALERERLAWDREQGQLRAQMEYQAKQEANDARALEAASGLQQDQLRRDTAMITLAAKQGVEYDKIAADTKIKERDLAIKEFTAGAKLELDANKQALVKEELDLARSTGEGI